MLDADLSALYGVPTKSLNLAVKRNLVRFPKDFMIKLTQNEIPNLRFHFETSSWGGRRHLPYAFTQEGVAMLSSILHSERAVHVNIQIMRVFVKLRELMISHKDLARKIENLERKFQNKFKEHDQKFILVFNAIKDLLTDKEEANRKRGPMGFVVPKQ